jgi:hypothetical protein
MVGVRFEDGDLQEFWREELQQVAPRDAAEGAST